MSKAIAEQKGPSPLPSRPERPAWRTHALAGAITLLGLALAVRMAAQSDAVYQDDDACHYNIARDAWTSPQARWTWWARPGYNMPAAVVAHFFGFFGCRIFSAVQTAAAAYLSYLIARRVLADVKGGEKFAVLAPALVWVQPLTTTLAITTLTETPALLYLTLATWLFLSDRRVLGCLAASLCFITRYETMALVPIFMLAAAVEFAHGAGWKVLPTLKTWRLWACAGALAFFPLLYMGVAWLEHVRLRDSFLFPLYGKMTGQYGSGPWGIFMFNWIFASGPAVLALAGAGALLFLRRGWLPTALCLALVGVHSYMYHEGLGDTGGYPRFLVPLSGLTAAMAACGLAGMVRLRAWGYGPVLAICILGFALHDVQTHDGKLLSECCDLFAWRADRPPPGMDAGRLNAGILVGTAVLGAAAVVVAATRKDRAMRSAAVFCSAILLVLAAAYAFCSLQPLRLDSPDAAAAPLRWNSPLKLDSDFYADLARAARYVGRSPYSRSRAVTCHVIFPMLTDSPCVVMPAADALPHWVSSPPGTLFYRDAKWCPAGAADMEPNQPGDILWRHGRWLFGTDDGWVSVFVRTADQDVQPAAVLQPIPIGGG